MDIPKEYTNGVRYTITEDGKIYNHKYNRYVNGFKHKKKTGDYICFGFGRKGKEKELHRLLAECFIPNPENLPVVDHINQNTLDNRLVNLRWASKSTNAVNSSKPTKNKLDVKYVSECTNGYGYYIQISRNCVKYRKWALTLEDAIITRDIMLSELDQ